MAVRICRLESWSSPSRGITRVTILPEESSSGTTILKERENMTRPTLSSSGIFRVRALRAEIRASSPTLCRSSTTINAGESCNPSTIRLTVIEACGTGVTAR